MLGILSSDEKEKYKGKIIHKRPLDNWKEKSWNLKRYSKIEKSKL